jgi:membrane protein CcdC involved in cytochrome C biogenesis
MDRAEKTDAEKMNAGSPPDASPSSKLPNVLTHGILTQGDWPERVGMLGVIGAIAGLIIYGITEMPESKNPELGYAAVAFTAVISGVFGFVVERGKIVTAALFALLVAVVCSFVVYWNTSLHEYDWDLFRIISVALASGIATPLYQAWQDSMAPKQEQADAPKKSFNLRHLDYRTIHDRAWNNVVLFGAGWAITGAFMLLLTLISQLFLLIKIEVLEELLRESWFMSPLLGGSFGAVVAILRDREKIVASLQNVLRKVASFFTPVLAVGLVAFLCSLPFTGLAPLWEATGNTSAIILAVATAGVLFINILIGDSQEDEAKTRVFIWTAQALTFTLIPLGLIASYSISLRIGQYGLTPERLWGVVFVGVAMAYAITYCVTVIMKRAEWMAQIRRANVMLAAGLCGLALFLAMPFVSFGSISTRSQLAMLDSRQVSPEKFDWAALRYDFGPSGREAVKRLAKEGKTAAIKTAATNAAASEDRWALNNDQAITQASISLDDRLTILPQKIPLPEELKVALIQYGRCGQNNIENSLCIIFYTAGTNSITGIKEECNDDGLRCTIRNFEIFKKAGSWEEDYAAGPVPTGPPIFKTLKPGDVEIRDVKRQQVFIGGKPVGEIF